MPQFIILIFIALLMIVSKLFFFNLEKEYASSFPGRIELISLIGIFIVGSASFIKKLRLRKLLLVKRSFFKIETSSLLLIILTLIVVGASIFINLNKGYIHWDAIALYDARAKFLEQGMKFSDMPALSKFDNLNKYYYLLYPPYTSVIHYYWDSAFNVSKLPVGLFYSLNLFLLVFGVFLLTRKTVGEKTAAFLSLLTASNNIIFLISVNEYTNLPYTLYLVLGIFLLFNYLQKERLWELLFGIFFISTSIWIRFLEPIWFVIFLSFVLVFLFEKALKSKIFPVILMLVFCLIEYFSWSYFVAVIGKNPSVLNFSLIALIEPLLGFLTGRG